MKTTVGKLRNITTGILHTEMGDVYRFLEEYLNASGIMLPSACRALGPILRRRGPESWFDKAWQKTGLDDEVEIADVTEEEKKEFWIAYEQHATELWDSIGNKTIVVKT
jgi:hypothetical protein